MNLNAGSGNTCSETDGALWRLLLSDRWGSSGALKAAAAQELLRLAVGVWGFRISSNGVFEENLK